MKKKNRYIKSMFFVFFLFLAIYVFCSMANAESDIHIEQIDDIWDDGRVGPVYYIDGYLWRTDQASYTLYVYSVNKGSETITEIDNVSGLANLWDMAYDGTYYHIITRYKMYAFSFDGSTLTNVGNISIDSGYDICCVGSKIVVPIINHPNSMLRCYTFNGTAYHNFANVTGDEGYGFEANTNIESPLDETTYFAVTCALTEPPWHKSVLLYKFVGDTPTFVTLYVTGGWQCIWRNDYIFCARGTYVLKMVGETLVNYGSMYMSYSKDFYVDTSENLFFRTGGDTGSKNLDCFYVTDHDTPMSISHRRGIDYGWDHEAYYVTGFDDDLSDGQDGMLIDARGRLYRVYGVNYAEPVVNVSLWMSDSWDNHKNNCSDLDIALSNVAEYGTVYVWNGTYNPLDEWHVPASLGDGIPRKAYNRDSVTLIGNGSSETILHNDYHSEQLITLGTYNFIIKNVTITNRLDINGVYTELYNVVINSVASGMICEVDGDFTYFNNVTVFNENYRAIEVESDNNVFINVSIDTDGGAPNQAFTVLASSSNNYFVDCIVAPDNHETGFQIEGDTNYFYRCIVANVSNDGFNIAGANNIVRECNVSNTGDDGVVLAGNNNTILLGEIYGADGSGDKGVYVSTSNHNITGVYVHNCYYGIHIDANNCNVSHSNMSYNSNRALYLVSSSYKSDNIVYGNTFYNNTNYAIKTFNLEYSNISNNGFYGNGIYFDYGRYNTVYKNIFQPGITNEKAIYFYRYASTNVVHSNYFLEYDYALHFAETGNTNNLVYNNFFNCTQNILEECIARGSSYETKQTWNISKTLETNILGGPYIGGNWWNTYHGYDSTGDYIGDTDVAFADNENIPRLRNENGSYVILRPTGAGDEANWARLSEAQNWMEVDEIVFDENSSYVYTAAEDTMDSYGMADRIFDPNNFIASVSFHVMARCTSNEDLWVGFLSVSEEEGVGSFVGTPALTYTEYNYSHSYGTEMVEGEGDYRLWDEEKVNDTELIIICDGEYSGNGGPMTIYVSQAWMQVNWGLPDYSIGDHYPLVYFPAGPTNVTAEINGTSYGSGIINITINWTSGGNADRTIIVRNESGYAISWTNGTVVYNDTGNTTNTPIMFDHYYTLWGWNELDNAYSYPTFLHFGAVKIECFNESNVSTGLIFDILFKDESGSDTYYAEDQENIAWFDFSWIPHDTEVRIKATSGVYRERTLIYYLTDNVWTHLIIYLNHGHLYYIKVIDEIDYGIDDVKVTVSRFLNGSFQLIASDYTDPYGMVGFYFMPQTEYMADFYKNGYNNLTETFDTDPYYYGYNYPIIFRLTFSTLPPVDTDELFANIIWSLEPNKRYWNTSFTIFFNISSLDNNLQYFSMRVYYVNTTTGIDDLLFSGTNDTVSGGSISYMVNNNSGKYKADCYFKKTGFPETDVAEEGSRIYFISWGGLYYGNLFENIPAWLFFAIIIILAAVITAFLFPYAGIGAGFVGLGVITFGLVLKPGVVVGDVSGWAILTITTLVYTIGILLWSRI